MNKYFTTKIDGKDDVFADDFNNAFDSVETDMNARQKTSEKNVADGYAGLDSTGKINKEQIPETTASDVTYTGTESGLSALNVQSALDELASDYEQGKVESDNRYLPQDTAAGTEPQTEYALAANAINYQVYGNSVQDGTPTPESPVEIQSVGDLVTSGEYAGKYDVPITVCGKNLFDINGNISDYYENLAMNKTEKNINNGDGSITVVSNAAATAGCGYKIINVAGNTYTFSCDVLPTGKSFALFVCIPSKINYLQFGAKSGERLVATVSFPEDINEAIFSFCTGGGTGAIISNIQLEAGSTATAYAPYRAETKHYYLDEPLRKVDTYSDYIDYKQQKVIRNVAEVTLNGSETWRFGKALTNTIAFYYTSADVNDTSAYSMLSDKFIGIRIGISSDDREVAQVSGKSMYIRINKSRLSEESVDAFKTWLSTNNVKALYLISTPIEEPLTLAPMPLKEGTNNITTGTAVKPSNVIVDYYQNPTDVINSLKAAIVAMQSQTE